MMMTHSQTPACVQISTFLRECLHRKQRVGVKGPFRRGGEHPLYSTVLVAWSLMVSSPAASPGSTRRELFSRTREIRWSIVLLLGVVSADLTFVGVGLQHAQASQGLLVLRVNPERLLELPLSLGEMPTCGQGQA